MLALFELSEPEPEHPPEDAIVTELRDFGPVNDAVAGPMDWLIGLLAPAPPPACVRCATEHVHPSSRLIHRPIFTRGVSHDDHYRAV